MPYFEGCEDLDNGTSEKRNCSNNRLIQYVSNVIQYPEKAKSEGIEGTVLVRFVVDENGGRKRHMQKSLGILEMDVEKKPYE